MGDVLKVLLLAALIPLVSANYNSFNSNLKEHIEKAVKEASRQFGQNYHIAFLELIKSPKIENDSFNVNVYLQVTTCKKDSQKPFQHRDECVERKKNTPIIDCLMCKNDKVELIDCARRMDVINGLQQKSRNECSTPEKYRPGASNPMAHKSLNEEKTGCHGCV